MKKIKFAFLALLSALSLTACGGSGEQGPQGIPGPAGSQGPVGPQGEKGEKGDTGAQGPQGEQGEKGDKGDTGAQGPQGEKGADGTSVLTGSGAPSNDLGIVGDTYINTANWDFYVRGENGWGDPIGNIKGAKGEQGETGPQGPQGDKGDTGAQGPQGEQGEKGDKGDTGAQGPQGEQGEQGEQGDKGDKGDKGDTGAQGPQGEKGADGTSMRTGSGAPSDELGIVGDSYIDITNWDFYVKGENGWGDPIGNIKGADGAQGPQGIQGEQGPQGEQGEAGKPMIGFFVETISQLEAASRVENAYIIMMDTIVVDRDFTLDISDKEINGRFLVEEGITFSIVGDGTLFADDTSSLIDNKGTLSIGELGEEGPTLKMVSQEDSKSLGYHSSLIKSGNESGFTPSVYTAEFDLLSGSLVGGKNSLENKADSEAYIRGGELKHTANTSETAALLNLGDAHISGGSIVSSNRTGLKCENYAVDAVTYGGSAVVTGGFVKGHSAEANLFADDHATISLEGGTYGYGTSVGHIGKYVAEGYTLSIDQNLVEVRHPRPEDHLLYYAKSNTINNPGTYSVAYADEAERDDAVNYYLDERPFGGDLQGVLCCSQDDQTVKLTHDETSIAVNEAAHNDKSFIIDLNGQSVGGHEYPSALAYSSPLNLSSTNASIKVVGDGQVLNNTIEGQSEPGAFLSVAPNVTLQIEGGSYAQDPSTYVNPLTHHVDFIGETELYDVLSGGMESIAFSQDSYTIVLDEEDVSFTIVDNRGILRAATVISDNEDAVTIVNGKLHPVALGEATLTASFDFAGEHFEAQADVIVKQPLQSLSIEGDEVRTAYKNNQIQLVPVLSPNEAHVLDPALTWTSSNSGFATVSSEGNVTIKGDNGNVTITATNEATGLSDSVTFNVPRHGTVGEDPLTTTEFVAKYGTQEHFYVYGVASEVDVHIRGTAGYYAKFKLTSGSHTLWVEEAEGFAVSNEEAALIQNGATIVIKCGIARFGKYHSFKGVDSIFSITQPA